MLGSASEADDAVQEAWLRLHCTDVSDVQNLGGWLTTVVSRVCLDMLRSRSARRDEPGGLDTGDDVPATVDITDPEYEAVLADSSARRCWWCSTLGPSERLAFVLHDMFAVPFDDIAPIIGCSQAAARQYAGRARRRVQGERGGGTATSSTGRPWWRRSSRRRARGRVRGAARAARPRRRPAGRPVAVAAGATAEARGANAVAELRRPARGAAGADRRSRRGVGAGRPAEGRVRSDQRRPHHRIDLVADPDRLAVLDVVIL